MSSSTSASTAPKDSAAEAAKDEAKPQPTHMTALEEDDEFEEFPVQDWDASETEIKRLGKAEQAAGASGQKISDSLWEDNWDDDDVEEDFSAQLRNELAKANKPQPGVEPMQH